MKQSHCIEDTAGFAEGGDAGGQAGGKARSTEAYRLHRVPFSKISLHQRTVILRFSSKIARTTSHAVTEVRNFTFSLQRFFLDPPCSAASF